MIKKVLLALVLLGFCVPSFAGEYENALSSGSPVCLYLYASYCGFCKRFDPIFYKLKSANKEYKFVRINTETSYGRKLMYQFQAQYVPFVMIVDTKKGYVKNIPAACSADYACINAAIQQLKK